VLLWAAKTHNLVGAALGRVSNALLRSARKTIEPDANTSAVVLR
jgi:hypothetical protein